MVTHERQPDDAAGADGGGGVEPARRWRVEKADRFLDEDLGGQRGWYDRKARTYKQYYLITSFLILAAGSATTVLQVWSRVPQPIAVATAVLGAAVVLFKGMQDLYLYQETWLSYRKAAESMKREYRLFVNKSGPYRKYDDEGAYCHFVERTEQIIAEEQKLFFDRQEEAGSRQV